MKREGRILKQRIRVVGIVRSSDGLLLLKRTRGRSEELPNWELPTGKIRFGEQPEEAMSRTFFEYLGAQVKEMKLVDAIAFTGLASSSQLANLYIVFEVTLDEKISLQASERYSSYKFCSDEDMKTLKIDEASESVFEIEGNRKNGVIATSVAGTGVETEQNSSSDEGVVVNNETEVISGGTVYFDGCSRGNPGPSGVGYVISSENGQVLKRGGEFVGFATSRVAEYFALKEACEQAIELGLKRVRFIGDSLMVINQMNGIYQVKNQDLVQIYQDVLKMMAKFDKVAFIHVNREQNTEADEEANKAVDVHFGKKALTEDYI